MTTRVPGAVSDATIDDVRGREAVRAAELAAEGHLLRLWRPPLQAGEWRTLGLFAADDDDRLEQVLVSMPLRIWRHDEVTPLAPHPNDPPTPPSRGPGAPEFLTTFTVVIPDGVATGAVDAARAAEARTTRELVRQGILVRLWSLPGVGRALGLWQTEDGDRLHAILATLPLRPWLEIDTIPLAEHPNDPARRLAAGTDAEKR